MIKQGAQGHPVTEVVLHTSATTTEWCKNKTVEQMRAEIRNWHVHPAPPKKPWRDIGYHWVVAPDGSVAAGRPETEIGAGVEGHNRGVIHICMIPTVTISKMGRFTDFYTKAQRIAVRDMLLRINGQVGGHLMVTGHNVYANKLCPGFIVKQDEWL